MDFHNMTPGTFHQVIEWLVERDIFGEFGDLAGMIRLYGTFATGKAARKIYFATVSGDGGVAVNIEIPVSLVKGRGVETGCAVIVTGRVHVRSSRYGLEIRLVASDIERDGDAVGPITSELVYQGGITLEGFRNLPVKRNPFPETRCFDITLIHSVSTESQVYQDCLGEIACLGETVKVHGVAVNMDDAVAIASAVRQAPAVGVLIIIRGGGNAADFAVLDDPRLLSAFAEKSSFRITGLGHSGNKTLLDMISDFSASTPTQAGSFIRETVVARQRSTHELTERLKLANRERDHAQKSARIFRRTLIAALWSLLVSFVLGIVFAVKFLSK